MTQDTFQNGLYLPVVEEFYSLQGEGYNTGKPAYFIRVGGCDICCSWCDSKISWDQDSGTQTGIETIIQNILENKANAIVVTGGEPLSYNLNPLCKLLKQHNITTFLETSGSFALTGIWDWICLSPKKNYPPLADLYTKAHELKVVIYDESDFAWAEENALLVNAGCQLFLQPEWSRYKKNIASIVEYIKQNPKWRISLQAHKFMRIP